MKLCIKSFAKTGKNLKKAKKMREKSNNLTQYLGWWRWLKSSTAMWPRCKMKKTLIFANLWTRLSLIWTKADIVIMMTMLFKMNADGTVSTYRWQYNSYRLSKTGHLTAHPNRVANSNHYHYVSWLVGITTPSL